LKNSTKLMVLICLLFAVALSGCLGGNDKTDNNTTASSFINDMQLTENNTALKVTFSSDPTTEHEWELEEMNHRNSSTSMRETTNITDESGNQIWTYRETTPGRVDLIFSCEKNTTVTEKITYEIEIRDDTSIEVFSASVHGPGFNSPKNVTLKNSNKVLELVFLENPTTGYAWNVSVTPTNILNKTQDYSSSVSEEPLPGAPSIRTLEYEGLKAGIATMTFDYNRSFEENSTLERVVYTVKVNEDKTMEIIGTRYETANSTE